MHLSAGLPAHLLGSHSGCDSEHLPELHQQSGLCGAIDWHPHHSGRLAVLNTQSSNSTQAFSSSGSQMYCGHFFWLEGHCSPQKHFGEVEGQTLASHYGAVLAGHLSPQ